MSAVGSSDGRVTKAKPFSLTFARLRSEIGHGSQADVVGTLAELERVVEEVVSDLDEQARAVADANVRAVELSERMSAFAAELETQNRHLQQQYMSIEETKRSLEQQLKAAAEANVDAMLEGEEAAARVAELERMRSELDTTRLDLERKAKDLEAEAVALAEANAGAVAMVLDQEALAERSADAARQAQRERDALQGKVFVDELTGLFNHRYFGTQLELEFARARRYGRLLSLVFIDLDLFKSVNDRYGHVAGDRALRHVAQVIRGQLRTSDIPTRVGSEPVPVRYGGEEFVLMLPETDLFGATRMAERVRAAVEAESYKAPGIEGGVQLTVSAGVASVDAEDAEPWDLVRRADEALYRAKAAGRNRVEEALPPGGAV